MSALRKTAAAVGLAALVACGSEPPAPAPAQAPQPKVTPPPTETVAPAPPVQPTVPEFTFDPKGLRDPFEPFIKLEAKPKEKKATAFVPKTPLQRYAVEELRLVGVIWAGSAKSVALVEDPEGKGYVVSSGTLVGDRGGRVVRIQPDRVDVEERFVDLFGDENVKVATMTLRKPEGEVNP
jgi:type IV pilus assembly protein PilP